jgi:acetylornithine deacetylase/succinyl-diaminopimelate desuccinylase-like protein
LEDFFSFLRFKTISADPQYKQHINNCADWIVKYLEGAGMQASLWETKGNPVVFAQYQASSSDRPTILLYHHYDVQPVDPLELWESDPFSPTVKHGEVYARGASDNKGQCYYSMLAIKVFLKTAQNKDLNIKILIEGEEEVGSEGLLEILHQKKHQLASDYTLIVDMGIPSLDHPAVTLGFRGIVTLSLEITGSSMDLHSGIFGGIAFNPLRGLTEVMAKIWDSTGKVQIPHFYDGIEPFDSSYLLQEDLKEVLKKFELKALHHEKGYTLLESNWIRPTCEINGICGGYYGPGFKTVIPAKATCKLSCRLVAGQDPQQVEKHVVAFLKQHLPKGLDLKIEIGHGAPAFVASHTTPFIGILKQAYALATDRKTELIMSGGSLPIAHSLATISGGETLGIGFALDDDYIHAPNEHFGIDRLKYGMATIASLLELLAEKG